jgi:hypothetical protein
MAKTQEKIRARELRRQGNSLTFIADCLKISKGSASIWCSDIKLSEEQKDKLAKRIKYGQSKGSVVAARNKKAERYRRVAQHQQEGMHIVGLISRRDLLVIGTALYWAEGTKKNRRVVFSNSDPHMIKLYISWLKKCLNIKHNRLKCYVGINQAHGHRINEVKYYWSNITGISLENFTKTSIKKVKSKKTYTDTSGHYGTLSIEVKRGTHLNYQILGQIEALKRASVAQGLEQSFHKR